MFSSSMPMNVCIVLFALHVCSVKTNALYSIILSAYNAVYVSETLSYWDELKWNSYSAVQQNVRISVMLTDSLHTALHYRWGKERTACLTLLWAAWEQYAFKCKTSLSVSYHIYWMFQCDCPHCSTISQPNRHITTEKCSFRVSYNRASMFWCFISVSDLFLYSLWANRLFVYFV